MDSVVGTGLFCLIKQANITNDLTKLESFLEENPKYHKWENIKELEVLLFEDPDFPFEPAEVLKFEFFQECIKYSAGMGEVIKRVFFKYNWPYPVFKYLGYFIRINVDFDLFKEMWLREKIELDYENARNIIRTLNDRFEDNPDNVRKFLDFFITIEYC